VRVAMIEGASEVASVEKDCCRDAMSSEDIDNCGCRPSSCLALRSADCLDTGCRLVANLHQLAMAR
jgi:hypothetical protein